MIAQKMLLSMVAARASKLSSVERGQIIYVLNSLTRALLDGDEDAARALLAALNVEPDASQTIIDLFLCESPTHADQKL